MNSNIFFFFVINIVVVGYWVMLFLLRGKCLGWVRWYGFLGNIYVNDKFL